MQVTPNDMMMIIGKQQVEIEMLRSQNFILQQMVSSYQDKEATPN